MRRLPLLVLAGLAAATVAACGGNPPPAQPGPQANADSIAAAERARQDSIARAEADARAREEAQRVARQRAADSPAAMGHTTEAGHEARRHDPLRLRQGDHPARRRGTWRSASAWGSPAVAASRGTSGRSSSRSRR